MSLLRLPGPSEKLGSVSTSDEFLTWEIPDNESEQRMRYLLNEMGRLTLVLDAVKYGNMHIDSSAQASFIEQEDFAAGRDESAHQVRFGQLIISGKDIYEQPDFVAIKPYENRADLYREWAAHEYLNSLFDRQIGYINLGVHNDKHGTESTVSQYDHDVTSFDSSFWADHEAPSSALRAPVLQRHATLGMLGLGLMHGVRMIHGDAQVKNLAADRVGPRAIDLETADILDADQIDDPLAIARTRRDITAFISSMGQVEENRQRIIEALSSEHTVERMAQAYTEGIRQGRAALDGEYVPDFGRRNSDTIHDQVARLK